MVLKGHDEAVVGGGQERGTVSTFVCAPLQLNPLHADLHPTPPVVPTLPGPVDTFLSSSSPGSLQPWLSVTISPLKPLLLDCLLPSPDSRQIPSLANLQTES